MDHSSSSTDGEQSQAQRLINPYYVLLNDLNNDVTDDHLQKLCTLCQSLQKPDKQFQCDTPYKLFQKLEDYGIIGKDKTEFLKDLLMKANHGAGVDMVKEYEQKRYAYLKNVELLLGSREVFFVGRTKYVNKILCAFQDRSHMKCRCVLVYGLAGTGKTSLAKESCSIYKALQKFSATWLFYVDLRKATSANEVWLLTFNTVAERQVTQNQYDISLMKNWIKKRCQDTIILMDNADGILSPSSSGRTHFINTLADILDLNIKYVKILMTSRHPVDFQSMKGLPNFLELKLESMQVHNSIVLLRKMVSDQAQGPSPKAAAGGEHMRDDTPLFEISRLCGNNPQALRALASRLHNGFQPEELIEHLKRHDLLPIVLDPGSLAGSAAVQEERRDFEDQPMVLSALSITYEDLPENLKEVLLKLSVLPTSFSLKQGARILGREKPDEVKYDLEGLKKWCLVDKEDLDDFDCGVNDDDTNYYIHPLVRSVCLIKLQSSKNYQVAYEDAVRRFFVYINEQLKQLTELGHKDYSCALARFQLDKTNVLHYLELNMGNKFGCEVNQNEQTSANPTPLPDIREGLYSIFETFLEPSKRLEYYQNLSRVMRRKEIEAWAYLQGWVADELFVKAKYDEAWETVEEPLKILQVKITENGITNALERAKAQLMYVKGKVLVVRREYSKAFEVLKQALSMQQQLLGNHSITARCLNALGHAYFNKADEGFLSTGVHKAHEYHKKAWEMLVKITDGKPEKHFDAPMYLLNIGTSYHQMGKKYMLLCKGKSRKFFESAITKYNEAYELARALKLTNSSNGAFILKNMAMSHREMEDYDTALRLAIQAAEIRERSLGVHPTTARNLYFIGSLYDRLGDKYIKKDKNKSNQQFTDALEYYNKALKMEMQLGPRGHSIEYEDLKNHLKILLKKRQGNKTELETYQKIFSAADKCAMSPEEVTLTFDSLPDVARQLAGDQQEPHEDDDLNDNEADDNHGVTRRRAPALMFTQETASKRRCCSIH